MNVIEKFQSLFILLSVFLGLIIGQYEFFNNYASIFILPFLIIMLLGIFLQVPLRQLKKAVRNWRFAGISASINFILNPILAFLLGFLFLREEPALWIGFIMLMVTPCTDWYLLFTGTAKGNLPLSTSILPMNLILQLILLPIYLFIFVGTIATIDIFLLIESVVLVLFLPFTMSVIIKWIIPWIKGKDWLEMKIFPKLDKIQFIFLNLAIVAMFASQGEQLLDNPLIFLQLFIPIILFFATVFIIAQLVGKLARLSYKDTVSLSMTTLARNSPIVLAIALIAFPHEPLIALVLVIGPLIELPMLSIVSNILLWSKNHWW